MASIIRNYKNIQRISSVIVRAAERCFQNAEVTHVKCEFWQGEYTLELNVNIFEFESFDVEISHVDVNKCVEQFIGEIKNIINKIIKELELKESEIKQDIKEYDKAFTDSPLQYLSSVLMFNQIICNINTG